MGSIQEQSGTPDGFNPVLVPDEVERFQKIFTIPCTCTCTFQVFHLPSTTLMGANV